MSLLAPICLSILVSSILSGIFGMAGGLLLMGVLGFLLPLNQAMVLHGLLQAYSNGYRIFLYRRHLQWKIISFYVLGMIAAQGILSVLAFSPNRLLMLFILGALPLISLWSPLRRYFNIEKRTQAVLGGFFIQVLQLVAGAAGPIIDVLYVNSSLTRQQIMGTKAFTQTLSHLAKIAFYFQAATQLQQPRLGWLLAVFLLISTLGNELGHRLVDNMPDAKFKQWSMKVCLMIGTFYLCKGLHESLFG